MATITYTRGIPGGAVIAGPSAGGEPLWTRGGRPIIPAGPFFAVVLREGRWSLCAGWKSIEEAVGMAWFQDALNNPERQIQRETHR